MAKLQKYKKELAYSYALGIFPSIEAVVHRPKSCLRLLTHSKLEKGEGAKKLIKLCLKEQIRIEQADRLIEQISGKKNCYTAMVFDKFKDKLNKNEPHVVLHNPSDEGNIGTILRSALGLGYKNIAIILPAADAFEPRVIRASMGAVFSLKVASYEGFDEYKNEFSKHTYFPFMLEGAVSLKQGLKKAENLDKYSLIFGNEGSGLPPNMVDIGVSVKIPQTAAIDSLNLSVAAGIAMYVFGENLRD